MNYRKINNLVGWVTGIIALIVYLMTLERTVSFWDCGEFLATADKLEVGHSPGAPFFMLMQRLFAIFAPGKTSVALFINAFSAVMSAGTILFLFWTITHMARKLVTGNMTEEPTGHQKIMIMGAGLVGGLAYTFSDTFWFSAVEAEVYATSSFFTALTFWAILKWELVADRKYADRWLVFIAYLIGLSVAIHLLNLLTIPALGMVYYFRRAKKISVGGAIIAFLVSCVFLGIVQFGVMQGLPILASKFELTFVNSFGLPFDSGAITFVILLIAALAFFLVFAKRKGWYFVHTGILSLIFITIGFSSYLVSIIRSRADVPIDMTNPDNTFSFISYIQREQFGEQPLLWGPDYDASLIATELNGNRYAQSKKDGKDHYEVVGEKPKYIFEADKERFFPRIWDGNGPGHAEFYRTFLGLEQGERPTSADNMKFFMDYQMNWMWWRYFMWNYAGRQNDFQGYGNESKAGNWLSGITPIDKMFGRGDVSKMPDGYRNNRARNELYFLPLILGILGLVYQFNRDRRDGFVVFTLFFFTGIAIGIYLNMTPMQPRERDYAFAGSTYAFAIWIGLGLLIVNNWFQKVLKGNAGTYGAIALCLLAAPVLMASKEWDDHDRSNKTLARSTAINTLESCAPNAVLFTYGDNETYPLWYAQEIEGVRPDIRIINTSLLGIDWYIDQLNYKINDADAVPMVWKKDSYLGDRRNYLMYYDNPQRPIAKDRYFALAEVINFFSSDNRNDQLPLQTGEFVNYIPTRNFFVPTPAKAQLVQMGLVKAEDTGRISNDMRFSITKNALAKDDLAQLNILAAAARDGWKRPIYFSSTQDVGGFGNLRDYLRMEGTVYRIMPYKIGADSLNNIMQPDGGFVDLDKTYDLFMNKYTYGNAERNDVYFDEKNRIMFATYRINSSRLADELTLRNRKDDAIKVLDRIVEKISERSYYYDQTMLFVAMSYYKAGAFDKGKKIASRMIKNAEDDISWFRTLGDDDKQSAMSDVQRDLGIVKTFADVAQQVGDKASADEFSQKFQAMYSGMAQELGLPQQQQPR